MTWTIRSATLRRALAAVGPMLVLAAAAPVDAADAPAVGALVGGWSGGGRIHYTDGSSESIRCTGYYTGGGDELRMAIQCKSDTNPINMRSRLKIDGSKASGDWEERTFNAAGSATGRAGSDSLSLSLAGGGFSGSMTVSFGKSRHSVSITTQGIGMKGANISMERR